MYISLKLINSASRMLVILLIKKTSLASLYFFSYPLIMFYKLKFYRNLSNVRVSNSDEARSLGILETLTEVGSNAALNFLFTFLRRSWISGKVVPNLRLPYKFLL